MSIEQISQNVAISSYSGDAGKLKETDTSIKTEPSGSPEPVASDEVAISRETGDSKDDQILVDTPYQKVKNSPLGKFVRENRVMTGLGSLGSAIVIAGAAVKSDAFANMARYAIVPAVAGGTAILGALIIHDAAVNDIGHSNAKATAKIAGGTLATLGGAQVVGLAYEIPGLDEALTWPLSKVIEHGQGLLGGGVLAGGVMAARYAGTKLKQAITEPENRVRNGSLGVASTLGSGAAFLGGAEIIGRRYDIPLLSRAFTGTIEKLSHSNAAAVAFGGLIMAGSGVLLSEAVKNFKNGGNDLITAAETMGAVTAGLGGAQMTGYGLGIDAVKGLLTENAPTVGSAALSVGGAALLKTSLEDAKEKGLHVNNAIGATAGATLIPTGIASALYVHGLRNAAELVMRSGGVAAGAGLGLTAYALGKSAIQKFQGKKPGEAALCAGGSLVSGMGSLYAMGESLNIKALTYISDKVYDYTLEPAFRHVIEPTARFLFENPVAGAIVIAGGVGAYIYFRHKQGKQTN